MGNPTNKIISLEEENEQEIELIEEQLTHTFVTAIEPMPIQLVLKHNQKS